MFTQVDSWITKTLNNTIVYNDEPKQYTWKRK